MSDLVRDTIAALIAAQIPLSSVSAPPLGYGVDLVCVDDIDARMSETDPTSTASLAQDTYHRVTTKRGTLPGEPNYGIDLRSLLSTGLTQANLRAIELLAHGEIIKDDRVDSCTVSIVGFGTAYTITIAITPADPAQVAFDLVIAVTDGVALLQDTSK